MRRCGKSYLLFNIFVDYLLKKGVDKKRLILMDLELPENAKYWDAQKLYQELIQRMPREGEEYIVILDEVQNVDHFEMVLNGV